MSLIAAFSALLLIALDQLSKAWAYSALYGLGSIQIIPNVLNFTLVKNTGAAFGLLQDYGWARWFFLIFTLIVIGIIILAYRKLPDTKIYNYVRICLIFITAGAIGNYIDRLRLGYVVDFIQAAFINFPVFNLADIFVVAGTLCLGVIMIFFVKPEEDVLTK